MSKNEVGYINKSLKTKAISTQALDERPFFYQEEDILQLDW